MSQIDRIISKLNAASKDPLNPASPEAVSAFESNYGVLLPEGFRDFLLHVSNGGPGPPAYGLIPLGQPASDMHRDEKAEWTTLDRIREPFPFTEDWIWDYDPESAEGSHEDVGCGSVLIGNDGCGAYWHLIVTGPDRGIPWMIAGDGIQPVCPKRSFLDWYEDWLDGRDSFYGFASSDG